MSSFVPEGWSKSKLGEISHLTMGQSPSSETYNHEGIGLPFYQGKTDFGAHNPKVRVWCSEPSKVANENSILFTVRAPVGDVNITLTQCCIGRGLAAINGTLADQSFLYQQIQFVKHQFTLLAQGSTFEAVNGSEMREFPLLLPPTSEQQKIAQILTSVDEVIEKTQAQIDKLKDLKTAMMQELLTKGIGHVEFKDSPVGMIPVGWDCVKMNKIAKVTDGAHFTPTYMTKGVPFLRVTDLKNKSIFNGNIKFIPLNEHEELIKRCNPEKGDILFSKNGTIGLTRLIDWDDEFSIFVSLALIKILSNKVTPEYLAMFMESPIVKYQIKMRSKQGSVTNLHLEEIREFDIPLPSVVEQTAIIKMLSSIINKLDSVEKKHENLVNLKKALMQNLLTGKVRLPEEFIAQFENELEETNIKLTAQ